MYWSSSIPPLLVYLDYLQSPSSAMRPSSSLMIPNPLFMHKSRNESTLVCVHTSMNDSSSSFPFDSVCSSACSISMASKVVSPRHSVWDSVLIYLCRLTRLLFLLFFFLVVYCSFFCSFPWSVLCFFLCSFPCSVPCSFPCSFLCSVPCFAPCFVLCSALCSVLGSVLF